MRITIVGCGSIGSKLASAADEMPEVKRIYLVDMERHLAEDLAARLKKAIVVDSVEEELYHCDLVIEAASQAAARDIAPRVVSRGVDMMIMECPPESRRSAGMRPPGFDYQIPIHSLPTILWRAAMAERDAR